MSEETKREGPDSGQSSPPAERTQHPTDTEWRDASEQDVRRLLRATNDDSSAARASWVFFLALMAYFIVATSGISHKDLLLNNPVELPFLEIGIELTGFFTFAPLVFVLIHISLVIQHVLLSNKIFRLKQMMHQLYGDKDSDHVIFYEVHSYFFTQLMSGRLNGRLLRFLIQSISSLTFFIIPVLLLLYFQISFLPFHDTSITALHRLYIVADVVIVFILLTVNVTPFSYERPLRATRVARNTALFVVRSGFAFLALIFSVFVATIPDSYLDRIMTALAPVQVPIQHPQHKICNLFLSTSACTGLLGDANLEFIDEKSKRQAFVVTAYLFDGSVDLANGSSESAFSRSLIVADADLVSDREADLPDEEAGDTPVRQVSLSLRGRDLRYATLDRSLLRHVDLTSADLIGASLRGADLRHAKISCARAPRVRILGGIYEQCTNVQRAHFDGALLEGANLSGANLNEADFTDAQMQNVDMTNTSAMRANFSFANLVQAKLVESNLQGAKLLEANLEGARFRFATLRFADFLKADLQGAKLSLARAEAATFRFANLNGTELRLAWLQGADFQSAKLQGADLRNANLQGTDFRSAKLEAADFGAARLQGANFLGAEVQGVDVRRALLWDTAPPRPQNTRKTLVDLRGIRIQEPTFQDNLAINAVFKTAKAFDPKALTRPAARRLNALIKAKSESWNFDPKSWTEPEGRAAQSAFGSPDGNYTIPPVDPKGKTRGRFMAYLACGDKGASAYLARGMVRRVIRSGAQIDTEAFCDTFFTLPIDNCQARERLPKAIDRQLRLLSNCKTSRPHNNN